MDIVEQLAQANPDDYADLGMLGILSARTGDVEAARRALAQLREIDRPYVFGGPTYYRAAIAALLGERDTAVGLIREWIQQSRVISFVALHSDPNFESLRGYPPFQEILRPKG